MWRMMWRISDDQINCNDSTIYPVKRSAEGSNYSQLIFIYYINLTRAGIGYVRCFCWLQYLRSILRDNLYPFNQRGRWVRGVPRELSEDIDLPVWERPLARGLLGECDIARTFDIMI